MDEYNKWLGERDYATGVYNTEEDRDYNRYWNDVQLGYQTHNDKEMQEWNEYVTAVQKSQWDASFAADEEQRGIDNKYRDESMAYAKQQDAILRIDEMIKNGVMPSNEEIAAAGLTPDYVQKMYNAYEDQRTEVTSEKTKAEAMDKINMYLAAGMEVPKLLQKQAGLTDDDMAAMTASCQNATTEDDWELQHVPSASFPEMEKEFEDYIGVNDLEGAESYIDHLKLADAISDEQYLKWLEIIEKKRAGATDTTVTTQKKQYPSSPGGKIIPTTR